MDLFWVAFPPLTMILLARMDKSPGICGIFGDFSARRFVLVLSLSLLRVFGTQSQDPKSNASLHPLSASAPQKGFFPKGFV